MASSVFSNPTPTLTTRVFGEQVEDEFVFAIELKTSLGDAVIGDFVALAERAARAHVPLPLHFVYVLDNSASMLHFRTLIQACATAIVHALPAGTTVAFVSFARDAQIVAPPARIAETDKAAVAKQITEHITTNGMCTNIHDAVIMALDVASAHHAVDNGAVNIVFVTDGAANAGVTVSSAEIFAAAQKHAAFSQTAFHCIGFGQDDAPVGADLLSRLARASHATFNHVIVQPSGETAATDLAAAIGDCFGHALTTLAKHVTLVLPLSSGATWITPDAVSGHLVLAHDEPRTLVCSSSIRAFTSSSLSSAFSFSATLAWTEAFTGRQHVDIIEEPLAVILRTTPRGLVRAHMFREQVADALAAFTDAQSNAVSRNCNDPFWFCKEACVDAKAEATLVEAALARLHALVADADAMLASSLSDPATALLTQLRSNLALVLAKAKAVVCDNADDDFTFPSHSQDMYAAAAANTNSNSVMNAASRVAFQCSSQHSSSSHYDEPGMVINTCSSASNPTTAMRAMMSVAVAHHAGSPSSAL